MSRVLMIAYTHYARDGRVKRHAESLAARGDRVDVISLGEDHNGPVNGVNVIGLPVPRYRGMSRVRYLLSYIGFFARAAAKAIALSRIQPYDLAIVCTMPDAAIVSALAMRAFGTRLVLDVHDTMPELYLDKFGGTRGAFGAHVLMLQERICGALADRVLAVHRGHAERLAAAGIRAGKIRVVVNSPDPRIFPAQRLHKPCGASFTIACHGTITRRLGLDTALRALKLLIQRGVRDLNLKVIGDGDHLAQLRALAAELQLGSAVRFCPPIPIHLLPGALDDASIGLVPNHASAATHLMLPVKLLEYARLGIPVICARLRTVERYFGDDGVAYFEPGNAEGLARVIERLYFDPALRASLAARAGQIAESLDWSAQQQTFHAALDSLLSAKPNSRAQATDAGSRPAVQGGAGTNPGVTARRTEQFSEVTE